MDKQGTIAAIATPQGEGGISMIRVSGDEARRVFERAFRRAKGGPVESHRLCYGHVVEKDGQPIDEAMGVYMAAPGTYTREDVCEISCHGGLHVARRVLNRVLEAGARLAEPGEFTRRAFLNGRIDLSEAEAVMALIQAGSEAAERSAMHQLEGGVSRFVGQQRQRLTDLLALIEAGNDFPEEIDEGATVEQVAEGARAVRERLLAAADERAARIVREGVHVALVGKPNVGKSSLLNAMLNQQRAIVTDLPGTTRDVLTERLRVNGLLLELSDTAGQREAGDAVEKIGIERAQRAERSADCVLLVLDSASGLDAEDRQLLARADDRTVIVLNKTDLCASNQQINLDELPRGAPVECVCALSGEGIAELLTHLTERFQSSALGESQMTMGRHIECAKQAAQALSDAIETLRGGHPPDLASVDLMRALSALSDITGESASESVIARVFERFCVGK